MRKRLLAIIATAAMVVAMMPSMVFAASNVAKIGSTEYDTLQNALNAAVNGDTIVLQENVTLSTSFYLNKDDINVTLDLNGKTLAVTTNYNVVCNNSTLTIKNGTIDISGVDITGTSNKGIFAVGGATSGHATTGHMVLNNVSVVGENFGTGDNGGVFMLYQGQSTLTVNGGSMTLKNNTSNGSVFYGTGSTCGTKVIINDATLSFTNVVRGSVHNDITLDNTKVTITGGDNGFNGSKLQIINGSDVTISDGSGRGITLEKCPVTIEDSTVKISNMGEGSIRFKADLPLTIKGESNVTYDNVVVDSGTDASKLIDTSELVIPTTPTAPATPEKSPNTGDNSVVPFAIAGIALAAMAAVVATRRREN
ncbi:MAG: LPXTG cell wall anchor domain-containing protein [Bacillota bacterium]|nr:LPXTG cell wall anchor domain-containing protein [Bacillota bacterium]